MAKIYDKKTLAKAGRMFRKGISLRKICRDTGIKSTSTIRFHFDPASRAKAVKRGKQWRKKNPERWLAICTKAARKAKRKNGSKTI